jgi:hypothetical protein
MAQGATRSHEVVVVDDVSVSATVLILVLGLGENWTMLCKRDYAPPKCELHNQFQRDGFLPEKTLSDARESSIEGAVGKMLDLNESDFHCPLSRSVVAACS